MRCRGSRQAWTDLKSTIADIAVRVWAWWQEDAVPAITAAWQWLRTAVTDIVVAVRAWWDETAQPAIVASWQWLRDTVTAISVRVSAWWDETAQPVILAAWEWLKGTVTGIAVGVRAFWDGEGAERVRTAWQEFTAQFSDLWVTIRQRWVESTDDESRARMAAMWERISSGVQDFIVRVSVQGMEAMITLVETLANIAGSIATIVNGFLRMTSGIKDAETASGEMLGPMDNLAAILERLPNPFAASGEGARSYRVGCSTRSHGYSSRTSQDGEPTIWENWMAGIGRFFGMADQPDTLPTDTPGVPETFDVPAPADAPAEPAALPQPAPALNLQPLVEATAAPLPVAPAPSASPQPAAAG